MSKLEAIVAEIRELPRDQAEDLQDWLSGYLEDQAELNPAFIESIERGKADSKSGSDAWNFAGQCPLTSGRFR